ncbi:DUF2599 domain-containing protein [Pseudomonas grimontii]|uniref:DUF2599 domain-containing protein n=1 Tax=Pseudomonas grimontii TaxID=129847 RepID=UPI002169820F|nr:DUF2599 domain-containing protein [Pseudomonas grimontii]MCS3511467.1 hypothetical protein [Pseudomonas grimontii]
MKCLLSTCIVSAVLGFGSPAIAQYVTHDQTGAATVFDMWKRYANTVADCGAPRRPAFLCSGLFLRGTVYSDTYRFWNYGPSSVEATAFSWLRKDAKFRQFASDHRHGYVMRAMFDVPTDYIQLEVLCAFPVDAGSHVRTEAGCGDASNTVEIERSCQAEGITTADAWLEDYRVNRKSHHRQCGFDVRPAFEPAGAAAFMQFVYAHNFADVLDEHFAVAGASNNEVRIKSWPHSDGSRVPIWAIFWVNKDPVTGAPSMLGKDAAQKDQMAIYQDSGNFIPIVQIALPMKPDQDPAFLYAAEDQAPLNTVLCRRFVDKAQWVNRYDPGVQANRWTLQVTPTDCGRLSQVNQLDSFYAEVVAKYGGDSQWLVENKGGVRRQLACLLDQYRNNTTYNIEPFRPNVSHAEAVAAQCNPI